MLIYNARSAGSINDNGADIVSRRRSLDLSAGVWLNPPMAWTQKKILIWGKTYPEFSEKYYETVCTGAVDPDTGKLVRIYPITLRYMKEPFKTYDWVETKIDRNTSDPRPESFKIEQNSIKVVGHIDTKDGWVERSRWILRDGNVFRSVEALRAAQSRDGTSLGLVRPKTVHKIFCKKRPDSERTEWDAHRARALAQKELFVDAETETKDLVYMPVQYRAKFSCDDPACTTEHDLSILDWGIYALSRRQYATRGAAMAERDVIAKIEECMDAATHDAYFFLGNTKAHPQNFMIVGLYYPPKVLPKQTSKPGSLKLPGF